MYINLCIYIYILLYVYIHIYIYRYPQLPSSLLIIDSSWLAHHHVPTAPHSLLLWSHCAACGAEWRTLDGEKRGQLRHNHIIIYGYGSNMDAVLPAFREMISSHSNVFFQIRLVTQSDVHKDTNLNSVDRNLVSENSLILRSDSENHRSWKQQDAKGIGPAYQRLLYGYINGLKYPVSKRSTS